MHSVTLDLPSLVVPDVKAQAAQRLPEDCSLGICVYTLSSHAALYQRRSLVVPAVGGFTEEIILICDSGFSWMSLDLVIVVWSVTSVLW